MWIQVRESLSLVFKYYFRFLLGGSCLYSIWGIYTSKSKMAHLFKWRKEGILKKPVAHDYLNILIAFFAPCKTVEVHLEAERVIHRVSSIKLNKNWLAWIPVIYKVLFVLLESVTFSNTIFWRSHKPATACLLQWNEPSCAEFVVGRSVLSQGSISIKTRNFSGYVTARDKMNKTSVIPNQGMPIFARSDWLLELWISCTIHWFAKHNAGHARE